MSGRLPEICGSGLLRAVDYGTMRVSELVLGKFAQRIGGETLCAVQSAAIYTFVLPTPEDCRFMQLAVQWAWKGLGSTYPNPCVGAVVVADGNVVGAAHSSVTGGPHAEVLALAQAGERADGATLYVTLEPCSHHGRTPPCTLAILSAKVARVCVGVGDSAAHVAGKGIAQLVAAGVEVHADVLSKPCREVHEHYLWHVRTGRPFVTLKAATSLDGRIATSQGDSKWISGSASRIQAHRLRAQHHAILVGSRTVLADDPSLTVRHVPGSDPVPIVLDTNLALRGLTRQLWRPGTIVVCSDEFAGDRWAESWGGRTLFLPRGADGRIALAGLLDELGRLSIRSLMVEGGGQVLGSFVAHGLWQELHLFQAPRILGDGRSVFAGHAWESVARAPQLRRRDLQLLGEDVYAVYRHVEAADGEGP